MVERMQQSSTTPKKPSKSRRWPGGEAGSHKTILGQGAFDSGYIVCFVDISQRGFSPFVYRDGAGWPAPLPYIRKIRVSVAIGTQSGIPCFVSQKPECVE